MDRFSAKGDYNITSNDTTSPAASSGRPMDRSISRGPRARDKFGNWGGFGNATNNYMGSYTRILSPRIINEVAPGNPVQQVLPHPAERDFDPSGLIPGVIKPVEGLGGLPTVNILGFRGFNDQPGSGDRQANYQIADNITWTRAKSRLEVGL